MDSRAIQIKKWRTENAEKARRQGVNDSKRYREANGLKCRARYLVRKALRAGSLVKKPCMVCGSPGAEAHHEDYGRPLDVQWLCRECHVDLHAGRLSILFV